MQIGTRSLAGLFLCTEVAFGQVDVARFVSPPQFDDIAISPNGAYLAFTQTVDDEEHLIVVDSEDFSRKSSTSFGPHVDVQSFYWVNDERILISPGRSGLGQLDFKQPTGEIFGIDADGRRFDVLFGYQTGASDRAGTRLRRRDPIVAAGQIVDLLPADSRHVIVQSVGYGIEGEINSAWEMDVLTGGLKHLATSPILNGVFVTDSDQKIRFVYGRNTENKGELYQRIDDEEWRLILAEDDQNYWIEPIMPYSDDGRMLVRDRGAGATTGLSVWNPDDMQRDSFFHHPDVDVLGYFRDNNSRIWAVKYVDHFPGYFYPDETHPFVALHKELRAAFGIGVDVEIRDETDDLSRALIYVSGPENPGEFFLVDSLSREMLLHMPRYADQPTRESLSPMDPVELTVRDGQTIRGYITVPIDTDGRNLPMVVLPHGGPHGVYDIWGYDYEAQLFASVGYAVLQVNFRGSGGRGEAFLEAGYGEWGGEMQDDVTDATHWAISEGIADPDRICIYGASYGAYAALTGVFREPKLYQCAIGMSGVYDLNLMFSSGDYSEAERGLNYMREVIGDDREKLDSLSPVENADRIEANVMLIHGAQDYRAPLDHALRMRRALRRVGNEAVWLSEAGETHGIMAASNRITVYQAMLDFLETSIGD